MKNERMKRQLQQSLNAELSSLRTSTLQRDQLYQNAVGGYKVKRKLTVGLVLALVLTLLTVTAVAAALLNQHIEKAMDIAADKGEFSEWALDDKIALINAMSEAGIPLPPERLNAISDAGSSDEERSGRQRSFWLKFMAAKSTSVTLRSPAMTGAIRSSGRLSSRNGSGRRFAKKACIPAKSNTCCPEKTI